MTSENPKAPMYYMDVYDNLVSAPRELVPMHGVSLTNTPVALDNARLLMDALNTRHRCGLSPRELLERCSAMEAALNECKDALEWVVEQGGGPVCEHEGGVVCFCKENNAINAASAALAKHKEA